MDRAAIIDAMMQLDEHVGLVMEDVDIALWDIDPEHDLSDDEVVAAQRVINATVEVNDALIDFFAAIHADG